MAGPLLDAELASAAECRLVTTGRRTGRPREIRIWFAAAGDRLFLLAGGRQAAHWVQNLMADARVTVRLGRRTFEGHARVVEGEADEPLARQALGAKYGTKWLERWLRESLPVAVDLRREIEGRREATGTGGG